MDKSLKKVVQKMFEFAEIDVDIDTIDFKDRKNPYYYKYTWTTEQEQAFRDWLESELKSSREMREALMAYPRLKGSIKGVVSWFNLSYGLKVDNESNK